MFCKSKLHKQALGHEVTCMHIDQLKRSNCALHAKVIETTDSSHTAWTRQFGAKRQSPFEAHSSIERSLRSNHCFVICYPSACAMFPDSSSV
jgi:hypothetical protein